MEGMIAAQLIATHNATMECYRRAMIAEQTLEGRRENLNQANKLSRTYATLIDALNRHRGKGQQLRLSMFATLSGWDLRQMMPTKHGVRSMRPAKLRIYGWCPKPHAFVAVAGALEIETKTDKTLNDKKRDEVLNFIKTHKLEHPWGGVSAFAA
jgi:hypothetical protein